MLPPLPPCPLPQKADSSESQETCTQYNVLKIARSLFTWTGDVKLADFYERALVNGILGVRWAGGQEAAGKVGAKWVAGCFNPQATKGPLVL